MPNYGVTCSEIALSGCNSLTNLGFSGSRLSGQQGTFYACGVGKNAYFSTSNQGSSWNSEKVSDTDKNFSGISALQNSKMALSIGGSKSVVSYVTGSTAYISKSISSDTETWRDLVQGNGYCVAMSESGHIAYSNDFGSQWTRYELSDISLVTNTKWTRLKYLNGKFIAIGGFSTNSNKLYIAYATVPSQWTNVEVSSLEYPNHMSEISDIIYDGAKYVIITRSSNSSITETVIGVSTTLDSWTLSSTSAFVNADAIGFYKDPLNSSNNRYYVSNHSLVFSATTVNGTWTCLTGLPAILRFTTVLSSNVSYTMAIPKNSSQNIYKIISDTYTAITVPEAKSWKDIKYENSSLYLVGLYSDSVYKLAINQIPANSMYTNGWEEIQITISNQNFLSVEVNASDKCMILPAESTYAIVYSVSASDYSCMSISDELSSQWSSVAYGSAYGISAWIAISNNKFSYSTDGSNWTGMSTPQGCDWSMIAFGNGKFVAVSATDNRIAIYDLSVAQRSWSVVIGNFNIFGCRSFKFLNGEFIIIKNNGYILTSSNGITWTTRTVSEATGIVWDDIAYGTGANGNSAYVVCSSNSSYVAIGTSMSSLYLKPASHGWDIVSYMNGTFALFKNNNVDYALSSDGGSTWTHKSLPHCYNWANVEVGYINDESYMLLIGNTETIGLVASNLADTNPWSDVNFNTITAANKSAIAFGKPGTDGKFIIATVNNNISIEYIPGTVAYVKYNNIPCIRYSLLSDNNANEMIRSVMNDISSSITSTKDKLLNNFDVNLVFFNTTGTGKYFNITDVSGKNSQTINNLEIAVNVTIGATSGYTNFNTAILNNIKSSIKYKVENGFIDNKLYIDDVLNSIKDEYSSYIKYIIFNNISASGGEPFSQSLRVIVYNPPDDSSSGISEFITLPIDNISINIE